MKKEAYAESTIVATSKRLKHLSRHTDLNNPETIKDFIARKECSNGYKESLVEAYDIYAKFTGITWNKPFYNRYDKKPKIPHEEKINMLIAHGSLRMGLILSMMKDLATRPIELTWLKVKDFDLETGVTNITTAKFGEGRNLKLKPQTLAMLKAWINKRKLGLNDRILPMKSSSVSEGYRVLRNRLAEKLQDPTIRQIRLYDFRHFTATMTYNKTKDLFYVKQFLGHKDLRSTLKYIQLVDFGKDEYTCQVAKNINEATQLIENGFEYITQMDGIKLFKKRK